MSFWAMPSAKDGVTQDSLAGASATDTGDIPKECQQDEYSDRTGLAHHDADHKISKESVHC
jgi:hypothetical protein